MQVSQEIRVFQVLLVLMEREDSPDLKVVQVPLVTQDQKVLLGHLALQELQVTLEPRGTEALLDLREIKVFQVTQDNEVQLVSQGTVVQ